MRVADHIKHLERIIENGELLRDQMRRTAEAREAIIRSQAGKLKQLSEINTLYKNRRNRAVMRLQKARNEIKLVEAYWLWLKIKLDTSCCCSSSRSEATKPFPKNFTSNSLAASLSPITRKSYGNVAS